MQEFDEYGVKQALQFIKSNQDFFAAPFLQQEKFKDWVAVLPDLSQQALVIFTLNLNAIFFKINTKEGYAEQFFADAIIGNHLEDINCLFCNDSTRLKQILNNALAHCFLLFEKTHIVKVWNYKNQAIVACTKYTETVIEQLQVIKVKAKYSDSKYETNILQLINNIKKEILILKIDAFKVNDKQDLIPIFKCKCLKHIQNAINVNEISQELHLSIKILAATIADNFIFGVDSAIKNSLFQSHTVNLRPPSSQFGIRF